MNILIALSIAAYAVYLIHRIQLKRYKLKILKQLEPFELQIFEVHDRFLNLNHKTLIDRVVNTCHEYKNIPKNHRQPFLGCVVESLIEARTKQ